MKANRPRGAALWPGHVIKWPRAAEGGDNARTGRSAVLAVHLMCGPKARFHEFDSFIEKQVEPLSYRQPALGMLCLSGLGAAAQAEGILLRAQRLTIGFRRQRGFTDLHS